MSSIIDEFFIAFKGDITDLKSKLAEAQNRLDEFGKKTGKSQDPATAAFKQAEQQVKDYNKQIKDAEEANRKLSSSFADLAVAGISAAAAFVGFNGLKDGLVDAFHYNLELQKSAALTGENAHELAKWDAVFAQTTDNRGEFIDWFKQYSQIVQQAGGDTKKIIPNLLEFAQSLKDLPLEQARQRFQQYKDVFHLPDDFFLPLYQGKISLEQLAAAQDPLITVSEKSTAAAREFSKAWQTAGNIIGGIFSDALTPIEKFFTTILNFLNTPLKIPDWLVPFIPNYFLTPLNPTAATGGTAAATAAPSGSAPLGIRSNNPGNLQPGGRETQYASLQQGLDAEQNQLLRYGQKGVTSLRDLAAKWPDRAGAAGWLANVSKQTGYNPDQPINLSDPSVRARVANGINYAENGAGYGNLIDTAQKQSSDFAQVPQGVGGAGASNTVNINTLTVHTQATDATGIASAINDKLNDQMRLTVGNYDDGVAR